MQTGLSFTDFRKYALGMKLGVGADKQDHRSERGLLLHRRFQSTRTWAWAAERRLGTGWRVGINETYDQQWRPYSQFYLTSLAYARTQCL